MDSIYQIILLNKQPPESQQQGLSINELQRKNSHSDDDGIYY